MNQMIKNVLCAIDINLAIVLSLVSVLAVIGVVSLVAAIKAKRKEEKEIYCFFQDDCEICKFRNKCSDFEKSLKVDRSNLSLDPKTEPKRKEKQLGSDKCIDIVRYKGYKVNVYLDDYSQHYYFRFCDHHGDLHEATCGSFNSDYKRSIENYIDTVFTNFYNN